MKVTKFIVLVLQGHTFVSDDIPREGLRDLIILAGNLKFMAIQVREITRIPEERLLKGNIHVHVEVILHSFELMMLVLLEHHDNVTLQHVWHLLTLTFKDNFFIISHAFLDVHGECLRLHHNFLSFALFAILLINSALTLTLWTWLLHLHLHEAHILHDLHHTLSFAILACFSLSSFGSAAFALLTVYVSLDGEVFLDAHIQLFERHSEVKSILGAFHSVAATPFISFDFLLALLIVNLTLSIICQHFEGSVDPSELLCSFLVTYSKQEIVSINASKSLTLQREKETYLDSCLGDIPTTSF